MVTNWADLVARSAAAHPARVALVDGEHTITYAGLDDQITAVAAGLRAQGVAAGDRVALLLGNRTPFVVALFGAVRAGAIAVPMSTGFTPAEVERAVAETGASVLVCDSPSADVAQRAELGGCVRILAGATQWQSLQSGGDPDFLPTDTDPESPAVLLFTAGSTGTPKPAMLSHRALLANVEAMLALTDPPAVTADDRTLAVLPLFHVYSLNTVLATSLAAGATVVLCERFTPAGTLQLIARHHVTVVAGAPPMFVAWSGESGLRESLASVRLVSSGAAPLPTALFEQFATMTGQPIWEGYGLTECAPVVTSALVSGNPRPGSVGAPLPGVEVRIVEGMGAPDAPATEDEEGETGEVWVRGPSLFSGYWPDGQGGPTEDGWYATGDLGYFDATGDLHLVSRRSDLILVSGFNVYPREVESAIDAHDLVEECAVIAVPHPYSGEAVKAFVVPKRGVDPEQLDAEEIVRWCEQRLARYKCPTIVQVVPELPHAPTGKLARAKLRAV